MLANVFKVNENTGVVVSISNDLGITTDRVANAIRDVVN